jgi:small subunit ribosomal protein S7
MPRKGEVPKRRVLPDPKFTDAPADVRRRITKFINVVMSDGKKSTAEQIVYKALDLVAERAKDDPLKVWDRALGNVRPKVEVKSRRVGGSTYQVPVDVRPDRSLALGMRWLVEYARKPQREDDGRPPRQRDRRRRAEPRQRGQEARGRAQDGRRQQGVRPLPLVTASALRRPGPPGRFFFWSLQLWFTSSRRRGHRITNSTGAW